MSPRTIISLYQAQLASKFAVETVLLWLNLRRARECGRRPPPEALEIMPEPEYLRALAYSRARGRLALASLGAESGLMLVLVLSGALGGLQGWIRGLPVGPLLQGVLLVYAVALLFGLAALPFSIGSQFVVGNRFGFTRTTPRLFALDQLKGLLLSLALGTPLLLLLFWLARVSPLWWLWSFAGFAGFQLLLLVLYPRVIAPLFNRFTPLPEGALKKGIEELASRLGFRARGIFVMDGSRRSAHGNAYFTGLGRTKRIVLFDTLVDRLPPEQTAAVLAHEIGHERKRHVLIRLALTLLASLAAFRLLAAALRWGALFQAFGFAAGGAPELVALLLGFSAPLWLPLRPLASWGSRRQEHAADRFAYREAGCGESFCQALIGLGRNNLANPTPHPWTSFYFGSHPTVLERLRALRAARPAR